MAGWRDTTLGELIRIKHGFAFLGEHFADAGTHVVLTPGNFEERGGFRSKGEKEKWYTGPVPSEYVLRRGDVLVAMTEQAEGLLGSSAIVPHDDLYLHNQRLGLVQAGQAADVGFVYHLFNTPSVRHQIRATASGTKVRHTAPSRIDAVKVRVPDVREQRRIAGILSAYDSLVENGTRRIRVLREMARALYREWFVLFRYPGHEKTPLVESLMGRIPKGWKVQPIQQFGTVVTGKTPSKANAAFYGGDVPFVKTPDMHGNMFILRTSDRLSGSGVASQDNKTLPPGSICVSCIGTIGVVSITTEVCQTNQQINSIVLRNSTSREFLLFRLEDAKRTLENLGASGATMGNVSKGKFEAVGIVSPPDDLLARFHDLVGPVFSDVLVLFRQIQNLEQTRDLLLPRLLSGQLSVEDAA